MKLSLLSLLIGSAAAFAPAPSSRGSVATKAAIDDLKSIAEKSNPVLKFYDPLELSSTTIWGNTNDATIAFLRQSEIKHGRVAMAAFVGYIVQSNGYHFPWPIAFDGTPFPSDAGSPPEQWDALSDPAKWQIILFVGFLEWFSESQGTHYMRGGVPGAYPNFSDSTVIPHPVPFNLFDPFGFSKNKSAESKANGLIKEINNGRLAMIGILGFISEQRVEGSVPLLKGLVAHYDGETMAPFA
eukprot:CAMPEP_0181121424 /NCGR_PEP_ID=MMETSP1071-20121207/24733_1 /TAXON_ID=35127 /ORGANISM="Thalassiosira sp., Strain NH16" /LENGTH=240 /DNA_ID=CAMNT_0023206247 /DNA_START=1 /DNA_END=723 /DNA_ORIENTATION=-